MKDKFSIEYTKRGEKDLNKKKFRQYREKIIKNISLLKKNPFFSSKKRNIRKIVNSKNIYRMKIDKLRCIYKVNKRLNICIILEIDFRENINYKKYLDY